MGYSGTNLAPFVNGTSGFWNAALGNPQAITGANPYIQFPVTKNGQANCVKLVSNPFTEAQGSNVAACELDGGWVGPGGYHDSLGNPIPNPTMAGYRIIFFASMMTDSSSIGDNDAQHGCEINLMLYAADGGIAELKNPSGISDYYTAGGNGNLPDSTMCVPWGTSTPQMIIIDFIVPATFTADGFEGGHTAGQNYVPTSFIPQFQTISNNPPSETGAGYIFNPVLYVLSSSDPAYSQPTSYFTGGGIGGGGGGFSSSLVQNAQVLGQVLSGNLAIALGSTPTNGNTLFLTCVSRAGTVNPAISSISQTGVTWNRSVVNGGNLDVEVWQGTYNSSSAGVTATITFANGSGSNPSNIVSIMEFTGAAILDQYAGNPNGTAVTDVDSGTTNPISAASELVISALGIIGFGANYGDLSSPNVGVMLNGVSSEFGASGNYGALGTVYYNSSSIGAQDVNAAISNATHASGCIATFIMSSSSSTVNIVLSDGGSGADVVASLLEVKAVLSDLGVGNDLVSNLKAAFSLSDVSVGFEVFYFSNSIMLSDNGLGFDVVASLKALVVLVDFGSSVDLLSLVEGSAIFLTDVGQSSDALGMGGANPPAPVVVALPLSDVGASQDIIFVLGAIPIKAIVIQTSKGSITLQSGSVG